MFSKFKELFSSENLLDTAFNMTLTMLEFDHKMYSASVATLRKSDSAELPFDFKKTDRKINKFEREVRRKVLTHLSVTGTQNVVPGLVLVSIVIDVERIGDYTKNIAGLATMHPARLEGGTHEKTLARIENSIEDNFPVIIEVLKSQEQSKARDVMRAEESLASEADKIVSAMVRQKDGQMSPSEAVSLAMYARYLKRINAHLTNIASSIVNPFPRIGFREKKK